MLLEEDSSDKWMMNLKPDTPGEETLYTRHKEMRTWIGGGHKNRREAQLRDAEKQSFIYSNNSRLQHEQNGHFSERQTKHMSK